MKWDIFDFSKSKSIGSIDLADPPKVGDAFYFEKVRYRIVQMEDSKKYGQGLGVVSVPAEGYEHPDRSTPEYIARKKATDALLGGNHE